MKKLLFGLGMFLFMTVGVFADSASIGGDGNTVVIMDNNEIQMVDEVITIDVYDGEKESDYGLVEWGGYVEVDVVYTFLNSTDEAVTVNMGFPENCGWDCYEDAEDWEYHGEALYETYKLLDFEALDGDEMLDVTFQADLHDGSDLDHVYRNWHLFDVEFEAGESKQITNRYWILPWRYKHGSWFNYVLETGASWKDDIEKLDVYVNFHGDLDLYGVDKVGPLGYEFNLENNSIEWHLENLEPTEDDNISVTYDAGTLACMRHGDNPDEDASSYLPYDEKNNIWYDPCNAFDEINSTAWVEGVEGDGIGEWVRIYLDPAKVYYGFDIFAGYGGSTILWEENNRLKKISINFSNGESMEFDLADIYEDQSFSLDGVAGVEYADVEILEVYEGSKYDDTALAEVNFHGLLAEGLEGTFSTVFSDILTIHPNADAIVYLKERGVVEGYGDGSFGPDNSINRAELMKMVVEMEFGVPEGNGDFEDCFSDVGDEWYASYVCYAKEQGWVDGYGDGTFRPGNDVNRAEAIKIIENVFYDGDVPEFELDIDTHGIFYEPNDVGDGEWYYPFLMHAVDYELLDLRHIESDAEGWWYFPGEDMTRKEVAEMVYRLLYAQERAF